MSAEPDRAPVAVVTGASSPIGGAVVRRLLADGARVLATGRDVDALTALATGPRAGWFAADATDPEQVASVRDAAERRFGPVDLLVTAAGGGGRPGPFADLAVQEWDATIARNLTTTYLALRTFLPGMAERGRGSVVTVASDAALRVSGASTAYAVAKAAVLALTREVAAEYAGRGVRINAVAPGAVLTPRLQQAGDTVLDTLAATHPSGRLGTVEDVADAVAFLLGERAGWITGHTLDLGARVLT